MADPCIVHQCPTCQRWCNIINKQVCCGNQLYLNAPNIEEIKEWVGQQEKNVVEKVVTEYTRYGKTHERVVKKGESKRRNQRNKLDPDSRLRILKRDKNKCTKCGSKEKLHVHHIVPKSKGGSNESQNLTTLCDLCHAEEHRGEPIYNVMVKSLFDYKVI